MTKQLEVYEEAPAKIPLHLDIGHTLSKTKASVEATLFLILSRVKMSKSVGTRLILEADGGVELGFVTKGRRGEG